MVNSDLNAKTVDELVAVSKAKPGTLNLSHRLGAAASSIMDSLKRDKGADWVRVPFKGGGEATTAILGGSTPIGLIGLGNVIVADQGRQDDGAGADQQHPHAAIAGRADLRRHRLQGRAVADLVRAVRAARHAEGDHRQAQRRGRARGRAIPAFRDKYIISRGLVPAINTPDEFAAEIKADRAGAKEVVKESGLEPQ